MERGHTLYFPAKPEKENRNFRIFNWGKIVMSLSNRSQLNRRESLGKALMKLCLLLKQGQKLVLSDALAVQSQGPRILRSKGFKS